MSWPTERRFVMPSNRRYGKGKWPQNQFTAIVASYWKKGLDADDVAAKLGTSVGHIESIYGHVELVEQDRAKGPGRSAPGSASDAPPSSERSERPPQGVDGGARLH